MKRALGIDYGDARIGLAVSDELRMLAHPLETVQNTPKALPRIKAVISEKSVDVIVLGLPKNMDGTRGASAEKVEAFATAIRSAPCTRQAATPRTAAPSWIKSPHR